MYRTIVDTNFDTNAATILKEFYTGTTQNRPRWDWLMKQLQPNDTIVFDSVSRMSRNATEGFKDYKTLYQNGIHLVFLNEPLINTFPWRIGILMHYRGRIVAY